MPTAAFDRLARSYDELWTSSPIGVCQRDAVWSNIEGLFRSGETVLDLGCGTGADAAHLMKAGVHVEGIDNSSEMVRIAREHGVDARTMAIEDIDGLETRFDGAISDFGAINCVEDVSGLRDALVRLIRPGGYMAICVMGQFCLWEMAYFLLRLQPRKAFRRFRGKDPASSVGLPVFYWSVHGLAAALRPGFRLVRWSGVGVCVPPSFVKGFSAPAVRRFATLDRWCAHWRGVRALSDHRLLIFVRSGTGEDGRR